MRPRLLKGQGHGPEAEIANREREEAEERSKAENENMERERAWSKAKEKEKAYIARMAAEAREKTEFEARASNNANIINWGQLSLTPRSGLVTRSREQRERRGG